MRTCVVIWRNDCINVINELGKKLKTILHSIAKNLNKSFNNHLFDDLEQERKQ